MTITNVDSLSQPSKVLTTTPAIIQHTNKSSIKDQPIVKSSLSSSSTSAGHTVNQNATKLSTKTPPLPADMLSPPKKATDHSINSIISSTAPIISHSKNENPKSSDLQSSGGTTRIINLDNLSTNDILSTAAASAESNIRIKSVETLNKTVPKNAAVTNPVKQISSTKDKESTSKKPHTHSGSNSQAASSIQKPSAVTGPKSSLDTVAKSTPTTQPTSSKSSHSSSQKSNFASSKPSSAVPHTQIQKPAMEKTVPCMLSPAVEEISSDSDDVTFVCETKLKQSKTKSPISNVIKSIKSSNNSSRSNSPNSQAQRRRREASVDGKEELVDVMQIMEAIKELQVFKKSFNFRFACCFTLLHASIIVERIFIFIFAIITN